MKTFPDFRSSSILPPDIDNAEIPARTGSPVVWRRSGRVVYYELFETVIKPWKLVAGAGGGAGGVAATYTYRGGSSYYLNPGAATSSYLVKSFPYTGAYNVGIETMFTTLTGADNHFKFHLMFQNGARQFSGDFETELDSGALSVNGDAGNLFLQNFPIVFVGGMSEQIWHNLKVVFNLLTGRIKEAWFDHEYFDLDYRMTTGVSTAPHVRIMYEVIPGVNYTIPIYIEDFIYTIDES